MAVSTSASLPIEREVPRLSLRRGVPGSACTTFAIGGPFEFFADIPDEEALIALTKFLTREGVPSRILGAGSNVLISSEGLPGFTFRLGRGFRSSEGLPGNRLRVGASTSLMTLSRETSEAGLSGLEFAGGIPASLGGAVVMNAGAHGGQLSDVLESVRVVLASGEIQVIEAQELELAYRHSSLPRGAIVIDVVLKLTPGDPRASAERRRSFLAERKARQPLQSPSAGSVFRNPSPERPAGKLIEEVGLRGSVQGGAKISELHGNWIVNESRKASDADVKALIALCQSRVKSAFGLELRPEIITWDSSCP